MALQFFLGKSGSGKSFALFHQVIEEAEMHPENNYIVLVPEQVTMQTKKDLVRLQKNGVLLNIDVLNFPRFAHKIFGEVGVETIPILDDVGKSLVLRKVAIENEKYLQVLKSKVKQQGYIKELKSVISELEQYGVKPADFRAKAEELKTRPALQYKMRDICTLYEAFQDFLQGKYIVTEELLEVLCSIMGKSEIVKNSIFVLDGYTGFTPVQFQVLKELLRYGQKVMVTVTMDPKGYPVTGIKEQELFRLSKTTIDKLEELAHEVGVKADPAVKVEPEVLPGLEDNPAVGFLEENLFRYSKEVYHKEQENISIHRMGNPLGEISFVAEKIQELVQEKGYHYKDFAIISGDIDGYSMYLEHIFETRNIPYFKDNKRCILQNPMMECISSAIEMIIYDFDYKSVMRYLRSGLSGLAKEHADRLENYVIALGIRGFSKWKKPFTRLYRGFEQEELADINEYRRTFVEEITTLRKEISGKGTVREKTVGLYHFLMSRNMQQRISEYEEYFKEQGEMALAKEYAQIYKILMDLLQVYVELLGEETVTIKEYWEILKAGFEQTDIGNIPPTSDQVMIGDMERSRLSGVKVLFFIGVNDGIVPKKQDKGGLLSDLERDHLAAHNLELAPGSREKFYIQRFYLYLNLTKAKDHLFVTYANVDGDGKELRPSYLIGTLTSMFERLKVKEEIANGFQPCFYSQQDVLEYLLAGFDNEEKSPEWVSVFRWFYEREEGREILMPLLELKFGRRKEDAISKAVAAALYGNQLRGSVSRLEQFADCACSHFFNYGLRLQEREEFAFEAADMGQVFHETLERFAIKLQEENLVWAELEEDKRNEVLEECLQACLAEYAQSNLYASARNRYMEERIRRILRRAVWGLEKQLEAGEFSPSRFEVSFREEKDLKSVLVPLNDKQSMRLNGRIDRLDTCETEDKVYVKVIDYKSGNQKFDLVAVYHGLQLQLAVYLNVAKELVGKSHPGKTIEPAGIFYFHIDDPVVDGIECDTDEKIEEAILMKLRMDGMANNQEEAIKLLDNTGGDKSYVMNLSRTQKGTFSANSHVYEPSSIDLVSKFVEKKVQELGQEILNGEIQANPHKSGSRVACQYCPYYGLCDFDIQKDKVIECTGKDEWVLEKMKEAVYGSKLDNGPEEGH